MINTMIIMMMIILINMYIYFIPVVHSSRSSCRSSSSRCCLMKMKQHSNQVSIISTISWSHMSSRSTSNSNIINLCLNRSPTWFGSIIHYTQRQTNNNNMKCTAFCYPALQHYKKFDMSRSTTTSIIQLYRNHHYCYYLSSNNNNNNNIKTLLFISNRYSNMFHSSSLQQQQQLKNDDTNVNHHHHHETQHDNNNDDVSSVGNIIRKKIERLEQYQIEYNNNNICSSQSKDIDVSSSLSSVENNQQLLDLEPISSTIHLLAHAMKLPWVTGYRDLYHILETNVVQQQILDQKKNHHNNVDDNNKNDVDNNIVSEYTILTTEQIQLYESYIYRRMILLEPIQYIIGQWDFLQYQIKICKPLLCPRPETEELVDLIVQDYNHKNKKQQQSTIPSSTNQINILDIGCGTGCIGISLCDMIFNSNVIAIDIEPIAIDVSNYNANQILSNIRNQYNTILCPIEEYNNDNNKQNNNEKSNHLVNNNNEIDDSTLFHIVVSNPPYILKDDIQSLSPIVINHESIHALSDNNSIDGMDIIRIIIHKLPSLCHHNALCYIEVDPTQPQLIQQYIEQLSSHANRSSNSITTTSDNDSNQSNHNNNKYVQYVSTHQDMMGRDRFVKLIVLDRNERDT